MLTTLAGADTSKADLQTIDLYRALCLLALGNTAEANKVIESMLMIDPLYRPDTTDLPPRMRVGLRRRPQADAAGAGAAALPGGARRLRGQELRGRGRGFQVVLSGLADPDLGIAGAQPPLSDLKVLASGFHDLASKASAPVETPGEAPPPLAPPASGRGPPAPVDLQRRRRERGAAADRAAGGAAVPRARAADRRGDDRHHHQRERVAWTRPRW